MVDYVLQGYGPAAGLVLDSEFYKQVILEFVDTKQVEESAKQLKEFRGLLFGQLEKYLKKHPCNDDDYTAVKPPSAK